MPESRKQNDARDLPEQIATLEYIEQMLRELCRLGNGLDAGTLVYLLEMASIEAADTLKARRQSRSLHSKS